jgi:hypothetical protein
VDPSSGPRGPLLNLGSCPWLNLGSGPRIMIMDPGVHYQGLLPSPILTSRRYLEGVRWLTSKYLPKPFEIKFSPTVFGCS